MAIVTRASVGRELTYEEMDTNLNELDFRAGYFSDTFFVDVFDEKGSWTSGDALPSFIFPNTAKGYLVSLAVFNGTTNYVSASGSRYFWYYNGSAWISDWTNEVVSGSSDVQFSLSGSTMTMTTSNNNDFEYRFHVQELIRTF